MVNLSNPPGQQRINIAKEAAKVNNKYDHNLFSVFLFQITSRLRKQQNKKVNSKKGAFSKIRKANDRDIIEIKIYFLHVLISLHCSILANNKIFMIIMNKNILWGVICVDMYNNGGLNKRRFAETRAA